MTTRARSRVDGRITSDVLIDARRIAMGNRRRALTISRAVGGLLIFAFASLASSAHAISQAGSATLDSERTEVLLSKFSVSKKGGTLRLKLNTAKSGWERGSHSLELLALREDEYFEWKAMIKKGSLCRDRNAKCSQRHEIALPHPMATHVAKGYEFFIEPESGDSYRMDLMSGNTTWMRPSAHHEQAQAIHHRETALDVTLKDVRTTTMRQRQVEYGVASNWFIVLSDCALEFYQAHPPTLHYDLELLNNEKHLPEELRGLGTIYAFSTIGMSATFLAFGVLTFQQYERTKSVHALVLILLLAHGAQVASLMFELMHITVFSLNGKGLRWRYSWFAADFMSEMLQGASEFIVEFVLLFLVCGWTTLSMTVGGLGGSLFASLESGGGAAASRHPPSGAGGRQSTSLVLSSVLKSFFKVNADDPAVKYRVELVAGALRSPVNMLKRGAETTIGVVILVFFALVHVVLELMSRRYNENFEVFHDHDHWPGYALALMRVAFAMLFIVAGGSTYATAKNQDPALASFIRNLLAVGIVWLLAFPFVIFTASGVSLLWRVRYVAGGCAFLQCTALSALGLLVLVDESFKKLSSVASDSGAKSTLGRRGFRAKVAID